ncbi:three-Cys-motif partner protein TcmP [Ginsengibacter hankyongi]|uniref:three-Cys-motif partner protein TcmP n=1 Tax=Ginsengibacter hankyongi TaxID=2607284 RepID=UPI001927532D|nr:three-Cys-motif partner protein TcmP [Ginsengibacter hankyongi]
MSEPTGDWGGPWTEKKLDAFAKYVKAYLTIMRRFPQWKTIYFDGFAGSGSKEKAKQITDLYEQLKITEEEERVYKGAAERVLTLENDLAFDYYYFIDKKEESLEKLKNKLGKKVDLSKRNIAFRSGDANKWIIELAAALKSDKYAALVFLDPFGMQIDWSSIKALKDTRSDVWILVPTGIIVNRLLDKAGELKYTEKLQSFFGLSEEEIKGVFYKQELKTTLFGEEESISKISKPIEMIAKIYVERMKGVWKYVTEEPLRLDNRNGVPLFHFVFASNVQTGIKIANQIIKKI